MKSKAHQNLTLLFYVFPALAVFLMFKFYPALSGIYYAMTDWNGINSSFSFVGLQNFIEILTDRYFWNSTVFTFKYVAAMVVLANVLSIALAVAIESRRKAKGLFRTIFYMPNMISMVIGGFMWMFIFTRVVFYMSDNWGWSFLDQSWIGDPAYSFIAIVLVSLWGTIGYLMIIYMAALQGVPNELREAAWLDGAGPWQTFWKVTLPLMRHAVTICVFWTLNSSFQVFDVVYTLTGGGPGRATQVLALNIYEEAFNGNVRFGYATAKSTVLFFIVLTVTMLQVTSMKRREQQL